MIVKGSSNPDSRRNSETVRKGSPNVLKLDRPKVAVELQVLPFHRVPNPSAGLNWTPITQYLFNRSVEQLILIYIYFTV